MSYKEEIEKQNQTLRQVPIKLWGRFKAKCAVKRLTLTGGFIEAVNAWLLED